MARKLILVLAAAAPLLQSCGFQPLYATTDGSGPGLRSVALSNVSAPDDVGPSISKAFARRIARDGAPVKYDLLVDASEQAERLAVQIDASVTRYNYRLVANYTLVERVGGKQYKGRVVSIASFNVVDSQYSTLFAENAARDKAASQLVEDIERDILLKIASEGDRTSKKSP